MAKPDPAAPTLAALDRAGASGALNARDAALAARLAERLRAPVRATVIGLPGAGKSSAINVLAAARVLPVRTPKSLGAGLPTMQVEGPSGPWGATLTLGGGDEEGVFGPEAEPEAIAARGDVAFARLHRDLPALARLTFLEPAAKDMDALERAGRWAASRTDMTLWCTRNWTQAERDAWDAMPDGLTANAVLVRPRDELRITAEGAGFERVVGIDLAAAQDARGPDGTLDAAALRACGGADLIGAVRRSVDRVRQALLDQADFLLARNAALLPDAPAAAPAPEAQDQKDPEDVVSRTLAAMAGFAEAPAPAPAPPETSPMAMTAAAPAAGPSPDPAAAPAPMAPPAPMPAPAPAATPAFAAPVAQSAPALAPPAPAPTPAPVAATPSAPPLPPEGLTALARAAARLAEAGATLDPSDGRAVIARAIDETAHLADALDEVDGAALAPLRDLAWAASDMAQLLGVERGPGAAADAAALMLQVRGALPPEAWRAAA